MHDPDIESLLPLPPATFHILLALAGDDLHGYAVMQEVASRTNGEVTLSAGTLYRSVQRMLELDDERRRYYRITPFGTSVARAETSRLTSLLKLARASGFRPERL